MTAKQVQLRRDTATNLDAATPTAGEPAWDTTNERLAIGNGSTLGGKKVTMAKDAQNQAFTYGTAGGTVDVLTLTPSPVVGSYSAGLSLTFKAAGTNTTAVTVNVNGLGAKNVYKMSSGALVALSAGDIVSGGIYWITYDGTQFQIDGVEVDAPAASGLVLLQTQTASASASIAFDSAYLTTTYEEFVFEIINAVPSSGSMTKLEVTFSTNNGSSYGSGSYVHQKYESSSTTQTNVQSDGSPSVTPIFTVITGSVPTTHGVGGSAKLYNANSSAAKIFTADMLAFQTASSARLMGARTYIGYSAGAFINNVKFAFDIGNITSGTFRLYGISKT